MRDISALTRRLTKLEDSLAAKSITLPEWAQEGSQGHLMICHMIHKLELTVSQAHNPDWYGPAEPTPGAVKAMGKLAVSMLAAGSYATAHEIAQTELAKLPVYRHAPRPQTMEDNHATT